MKKVLLAFSHNVSWNLSCEVSTCILLVAAFQGYLIACVWSCYKMLVNHRIEQTTQIFYHPDGQDFEVGERVCQCS